VRPLHRRAAILLATLSLLAFATPALAQKGFSFKFTQNGTAANAQFGSCIPDTPEEGLETCDFTFVDVIDGSRRSSSSDEGVTRSGDQACLNHQASIQSDDGSFFELLSLQSGCTDTFTLTTAADLSTAHLVATVPVFDLECDEEFFCEPVGDPVDTALDVTWSADEAQTVREHFVSHSLQGDLWCRSNQTRRGLGAFGTATGSAGGVDLGTAEFAEIFSGTMTFNDSCH
jgi:hypothetical protein